MQRGTRQPTKLAIYNVKAQCYWRNTGLEALPRWVTPLSRLYYNTVVIPYQGELAKRKNVQKQDVINEILQEYETRTPIDKYGLRALYDRAANRGYMPQMIYIGLKTMICKNYVRDEYVPPNNDPLLEVLHERMYMEDSEFRSMFPQRRYKEC